MSNVCVVSKVIAERSAMLLSDLWSVISVSIWMLMTKKCDVAVCWIVQKCEEIEFLKEGIWVSEKMNSFRWILSVRVSSTRVGNIAWEGTSREISLARDWTVCFCRISFSYETVRIAANLKRLKDQFFQDSLRGSCLEDYFRWKLRMKEHPVRV